MNVSARDDDDPGAPSFIIYICDYAEPRQTLTLKDSHCQNDAAGQDKYSVISHISRREIHSEAFV